MRTPFASSSATSTSSTAWGENGPRPYRTVAQASGERGLSTPLTIAVT
jgi:hypothetical protein